jgi:hypothetical protein
MRKITTDELFDALRHDTEGRFFSVTFQRRTSRKDRSQHAGEMRTMLCKAAGAMKSYKLGIISDAARDAEDLRCGVLTVWSMDAYMGYRRRGYSHQNAAPRSWRRIDLMGVLEASTIDREELPPTYRPELHQVNNRFRRAHMPRISRARAERN